MNAASLERHQRIEALLGRLAVKRTRDWDVTAREALSILLEESVVQAQRLELLEEDMRRHTHAYLRGQEPELLFEARTTPASWPDLPTRTRAWRDEL